MKCEGGCLPHVARGPPWPVLFRRLRMSVLDPERPALANSTYEPSPIPSALASKTSKRHVPLITGTHEPANPLTILSHDTCPTLADRTECARTRVRTRTPTHTFAELQCRRTRPLAPLVTARHPRVTPQCLNAGCGPEGVRQGEQIEIRGLACNA